jgi:hypothetical protein
MKECGSSRAPRYAEQSGWQVKLNLVDVMSFAWDVLKIVKFSRDGFMMLTYKVRIRPREGEDNSECTNLSYVSASDETPLKAENIPGLKEGTEGLGEDKGKNLSRKTSGARGLMK